MVEFINGQFLVRRRKATAVALPPGFEVLRHDHDRVFMVRRRLEDVLAAPADGPRRKIPVVFIREDEDDAASIRSRLAALAGRVLPA